MAAAKRSRTSRLSAGGWADAALEAVREGGLAAIAVEPLAARLGVTKGSFYWHFDNRQALVTAALERWEERETDAVIAEVEQAGSPLERLRRLFALTSAAATRHADPIELALLADAADPGVAAAMRRVTERRIAYLVDLFTAVGFSEDTARQRALHAYTGYLGHAQLAHSAREVLPRGGKADAYLDSVLQALLRPESEQD